MPDFLLFRLYGPLASWGEIAVGERRGSWSRPGKSGVLGMVAAALGIRRDEADRLAALTAGYDFAVRVDAPGVPLRDYHTAQTVREADMKKLRKIDSRPMTRRRELAVEKEDRETILSQRDYYADFMATVALWQREASPHSLAALADALRRPGFVLYLGRKSCPLGLPLAPALVSAETLSEAFAGYAPPVLAAGLEKSDPRRLVSWEGDIAPGERIRPLHTEHRRDASTNRQRWQFAERSERIGYFT